MAVIRRVTFKIYPNKEQNNKLHYWRRMHKDLYNSCVEHRKTSYKRHNQSVDYFDQQKLLPDFKEAFPEYKELGSHALQATLKRVDFAFLQFFKLGSGYPKFKTSRKYRGWTYPCANGWKALTNGHNGKLKITNIGVITMRGKAKQWGKPKTCTIIYSQGSWFASITVSLEPQQKTTNLGAIGIDFGCEYAGAMSNGEFIENPRFFKTARKKLTDIGKSQRNKRNPKPGVKPSKRWKKANRKASQVISKVGRQRQDWQHKVASQIVSDNSLVATEKLNIQGMTAKGGNRKSGLNRSILDVGIGNLKRLVKYKVEEAGGVYIEIPTQKVKPSQTCPKCGHQKKKILAEREHHCEKCEYTCQRDVASAQVMLNYARGQELPSLIAESSSSTECGSMRQLGAMKRQKRLSQRSG
jgi:putative transposase